MWKRFEYRLQIIILKIFSSFIACYNKNILSGQSKTSWKWFKSDTCCVTSQTRSFFLFFNLNLFAHRISNILPLKEFSFFHLLKDQMGLIGHSQLWKKQTKNLSSEVIYPLFFTKKQIICLDGNLCIAV